MIPIQGPLEEKLSGTYPAELPYLIRGVWRHQVVFSPDMRIFVINRKMRQALDIPLWEKAMMTALHTDDPWSF